MLLGRIDGDLGFNEVIGAMSDFKRNALGMAVAAGDLSSDEMDFLKLLISRVEAGIETTTGNTASNLAIDALQGSNN